MLRLAVIAHPGARADRVSMIDDTTLGVWVRARPVEGKANTAIERVLATSFGLRPRQVKVVAGLASRTKIVEIDLPTTDLLPARFRAHHLRSD